MAGKRDTAPRSTEACSADPLSAGKRDTAPRSTEACNADPPSTGKRDTVSESPEACSVSPPPGAVSADLAGARQGIVARHELLDAGVTRHVIERRAKTGELHRRYRGVYVVGHLALAPRAEESAALLACGEGSLISGRSAAFLWSLLKERPAVIDVTLVGRRCRPKEGISQHYVGRIDARDVHRRDNLLLTAPARTLIDLAADAEDDELDAALSEGRALRLIDDGDIEAALARAGKRKGVARMWRLLGREADLGYTRSKAERLMRRLMRDADLSQPRCNVRLHDYTVDFVWPDQRLVVEVDGYQFHGHRSAFERDRRKDQVLVAAGYRVVRVTWRQLLHESLRVVAVVAAALTARREPG
jgi:very-short-patch-repair endonuclease